MSSTILEKKVKSLSEKIVKYQNQISILKEDLNVAKESLRKEKKNKTKNNDAIKKISGGINTVMKGGAFMWRLPTLRRGRSARVAPAPISPTASTRRHQPLVEPPVAQAGNPQVGNNNTDGEMEQLSHFLQNRPQIPTNPVDRARPAAHHERQAPFHQELVSAIERRRHQIERTNV